MQSDLETARVISYLPGDVTTSINPQHDPTGEHPSVQIMKIASKLATEKGYDLRLDYYQMTACGTAFLGEDLDTNQRLLVKSKEEHTMLVKKVQKVGNDIIILTENSIYLVSGKVQIRKVNIADLQRVHDT